MGYAETVAYIAQKLKDLHYDPAVYKASEPKDVGNDKVFLVMGPWHHGQEIGDGSSLGALKFKARRNFGLSFVHKWN